MVYISVLILYYVSMDEGVGDIVVYTDYYMYLRRMGWPGGSALEYVYV